MNDSVKFLATYLRHPFSVGAVAPSSKYLAELMVEDMKLDEAETVIELGPGTGSFTHAIERSIGAETLYLAMELDKGFADSLRSRVSKAIVVNDSAENIAHYLEKHGKERADAILCGLPWASLPVDLQERIMSTVVGSLPVGGRFCTFAYIHCAWFPAAKKFRRWLESHFGNVKTTRVVWRNLPPAFVYRCEKTS